MCVRSGAQEQVEDEGGSQVSFSGAVHHILRQGAIIALANVLKCLSRNLQE